MVEMSIQAAIDGICKVNEALTEELEKTKREVGGLKEQMSELKKLIAVKEIGKKKFLNAKPEGLD